MKNIQLLALSLCMTLSSSVWGQQDSIKLQTKAVGTINAEQLQRNSSPELPGALYGLLPGLQVKQKVGWLSLDELTIRGGGSLNGHGPLILVDGIPRSTGYINLKSVEKIEVLKDGAATAIWGVRGANGVLKITTKRGKKGKTDVQVSYTFGMGLPINQPDFVDGYTYALARNEAAALDGIDIPYSLNDLRASKHNTNPDYMSNSDWTGDALKDFTTNHQADVILQGGNDKVQYISIISYKNDFGLINSKYANYSDRYDTQMKKYDLSARINLDVKVTNYTKVQVNLLGMLRENNRPNTSTSKLFANLYNTPASAFPIKNSKGEWGSNTLFKANPIAQIADVGSFRTDERMLEADFKLFQDLSVFLPGLKAEVDLSFDNTATYRQTSSKSYSYEITQPVINPSTYEYENSYTQYGDNSAVSVSNNGLKAQYRRSVLAGGLTYENHWGEHSVDASVRYSQENYVPLGRNTSRSYQSATATAGYNYANRYALDLVMSYSGASVLPKNDKFNTYPAVSASWKLTNEAFMKDISNTINMQSLVLRASWGQSGRATFGYDLDKTFWTNTGGYLINEGITGLGGMHLSNLPVTDLKPEESTKINIGLDATFLQNLQFTADVFRDQRRNMIVTGGNVVSKVIGVHVPQLCVGSMDTKGVELSANWNQTIHDFSYYVGANYSYLSTNIIENGEGYKPYDYLSSKGHKFGQAYGLVALGYFKDEADIANNPEQKFDQVRPGDIKYKDMNGDNIIDKDDRVAIGHSTYAPDYSFALNFGVKYKQVGIDLSFQGVGNYSRYLNTRSVYWPLRNNVSNISKWYLADKIRWTPETADIANVPRLSTLDNANNFRASTQWLEDASFLKLRNVNIYYNLPQRWVSAMCMNDAQIYLRGNNLFSLDHIKYLNCEDFSLDYPDLMSVFVGVNIHF